MTPVTQRIGGFPYGECVRASYASILDLPIDEVPRFDPAALGGRDLFDAERAWLHQLGLDLVGVKAARGAVGLLGCGVEPTDEDTLPAVVLGAIPRVEHLMSGVSPRGHGHRCVGYAGRLLWDPHPSRAGLKTVFSIGFLVRA